jgi:hypothetical protein
MQGTVRSYDIQRRGSLPCLLSSSLTALCQIYPLALGRPRIACQKDRHSSRQRHLGVQHLWKHRFQAQEGAGEEMGDARGVIAIGAWHGGERRRSNLASKSPGPCSDHLGVVDWYL